MVGFISFNFGLLGLHFLSFWPFSFATFVCLGRGHFLKASAGGNYCCLGVCSIVFLPQCFREASARLPQNTEAKPLIKPTKRSDLATLHPKIKFQYGTWKLSYIRIVKFIFCLLIPHCTPYLTNIPFRNLPRRTSFREVSAA